MDATEARPAMTINDLPPEILRKIFRSFTKSVGDAELIRTILPVCSLWRDIVSGPHLWRVNHEKTLSDELLWVSENNKLTSIVHWLYEYVFDPDALYALFFRFLKVRNIPKTSLRRATVKDISMEVAGIEQLFLCLLPTTIFPGLLDPLLKVHGQTLTRIRICGLSIPNAYLVLRDIAYLCPNLRELHVNYIRGSLLIFPLAEFQDKCPQLTHLALSNLVFRTERHGSFPELQSLTYENHLRFKMDDGHLGQILSASPKLKILDLDESDVTAEGLLALPATDLEVLNIAESPALSSPKLGDVFSRWKHSLKEINLSVSECSECIEAALMSMLSSDDNLILEELTIPGGSTKQLVEQMYAKCPNLKILPCNSRPMAILVDMFKCIKWI